MNQQPDKLFREKLEGYQKQAPASAWDKIEAGLEKKNNKGLWLKVAASLLFVAVAAYLLLSIGQVKSDQSQSHAVAKNEIAKPVDKEIEIERTDKDKISRQIQIKNNSGQVNSETPSTNTDEMTVAHNKSKTEKSDKKEKEYSQEEENKNFNSVVETSTVVTSSSLTNENNITASATTSATKGRTIVFTVEEVNEKYLDKNAVAEATPTGEKSSTLKKLLNKASDLTRDQDPLGELRQKKDEILALNFKKKNNVAKTDEAL